jgi:riboflavin kinase / FMN adenylyltransferase
MEYARDTPFRLFKDMLSVAPPILRRFEVLEFADQMPDHLAGSVLLLGNFDGFHRGHAALLDAARHAARGAPIGIISVEPHPRQLFAPAADAFRITTASTKLQAFARLGFSFAFMPRFTRAFASQSATVFVEHILVRSLRVAHVVAGEDFRFGHRRIGDVSLLRRIGAERGFGVTEVAMLHLQDALCSSSLVREMLKAGDMAAAMAILGAPWSVEVGTLGCDSGGLELDWPAEVIRPPAGDYRVGIRQPAIGMPQAMATVRLGPYRIHLRTDGGTGAVPHPDQCVIEFVASE